MRWFDRHPPGAPEQWSGLGLVVERRGRPMLRVEAAAPRLLRVCIGADPVLWARQAPPWTGLWWLRGDASPGLIPPLRAADARAVEGPSDSAGWLAAWARIFARHLADALDGGTWTLEPATGSELRRIEGAASEMPPVHGLGALVDQPRCGFQGWDVRSPTGLLLLRALSPPDAARVRALRKRARDGTLAPLLLLFVAGLDAWLLLDGHDRLRAALLEGCAPAALALGRVRRVRYADDPAARAALWRSVGETYDRMGPPSPSAVERLNRHLIAGFAEPVYTRTATRAWALPGGAARWRAEATARAPEWGGLAWAG